AKWGLKKRDAERIAQGLLKESTAPGIALRAVRISANEAARLENFFIPQNMRVPRNCVITRVLDGEAPVLEAEEDLSWWTSSDGGRLHVRRVHVVARRMQGGVQALISVKGGRT